MTQLMMTMTMTTMKKAKGGRVGGGL
jgi:hypothetical protein